MKNNEYLDKDQIISNVLVDISHLNNTVNLDVAKKAGLKGFIHKATQSTDFIDPVFLARSKEGLKKELYVGAYHFGSNQDPCEQVDFFINTIHSINSGGKILPCLDWEPNTTPSQETMSFENAVRFVNYFHEKTGIWPVIYGGYWMIDQLKGKVVPSFSKCKLWQGYYSQDIKIPTTVWKNWALWQYTDGKTGPEPHSIDGIGNVDRDKFNGSNSDLKLFWDKNSIEIEPYPRCCGSGIAKSEADKIDSTLKKQL